MHCSTAQWQSPLGAVQVLALAPPLAHLAAGTGGMHADKQEQLQVNHTKTHLAAGTRTSMQTRSNSCMSSTPEHTLLQAQAHMNMHADKQQRLQVKHTVTAG
jgi:uncharacterized protein HemX